MTLTFLHTLALTLPRQLYLVFILAYLKRFSLILIGLEVLLLTILASFYWKYDKKKAMIGAIASLFGPCFRVDELTNFYLITGLTSGLYSFISMLLLPIYHYGLHVYGVTLYKGTIPEPWLLENPEINVTNLDDLFESHCLFGYWYYVGITLMWTISLLATLFLHHYMKLGDLI